MTELSDQSLLAHWYRHRNAEAFHVLAARHARMVYATALRVLRDAQAAEDVSQESFLALAQAKRPPSRNVAAWLHRTTYHAALDVIRSGKRRHARDVEYAAMQPQTTHTTWDDMRGLVDEAVASLPEAWREPLVRHFFEQESHAAIAASLGIPRQTVTHRIGKGIERVRQQLKDKGVIVPAGALLAALIQENSASALPVSAAAGIGRIALAATPSLWAVLATYSAGAAFKTAAAMLVVGVGVAASVTVAARDDSSSVQQPQVVQAASDTILSDAAKPELVLAEAQVPGGQDGIEKTLASVHPTAEVSADASALASVSGSVVFPDGRPFAGATVHLRNTKVYEAVVISGGVPYSGPTVELDGVKYPAGGTYFDAVADASGNYSVGEITPGEYSATLTEPGSGGTFPNYEYASITLAPGEHKENFILTYGAEGNLTISGVVTNSAGEPVPEARVTTSRPVPRNVGTDALGHFTIPYLPESEVNMAAMGPESGDESSSKTPAYYSETVIARAGAADVRIVLLKSGSLEGRAIDAKTRQPIPSFEARHISGHSTTYQRSISGRRPPFADPDGHFSFDFVRVGDMTIVAEAPGYSPAFLPLTVAEGDRIEGLVLEMNRSERTLAGKVVSDDGLPIVGASIYLEDVPSAPMRLRGVVTTTDADGAFNVENAPEYVQFIGAWHPDFAPGGSEPEGRTKIVLKRAGRLHVEVTSAGLPVPNARIIARYRGAPNERFNATSARATTGLDGRATVEEIMPGSVQVSFQLPSKRSRSLMLEMAPGEEKSLQMEIPPASAAVQGVVTMNGAPASEGSVTLHVETESGPEGQSQAIAQDGSFRFSEVPLGAAELVVSTEPGAGRTFVHDVSLAAGEVTELTVDATMVAGVRGTVTGLPADEITSVAVLLGAMNLEEAAEAADRLSTQRDLASHVAVDTAGAYEAPLQKPGTYTLLLMSCPKDSHWKINHHEARVVEVPESGELEADFTLPD